MEMIKVMIVIEMIMVMMIIMEMMIVTDDDYCSVTIIISYLSI